MAKHFEQPGITLNSDERKIWWIASYPKSGNTWVRMFLNAFVTGFPVHLNSAYQFVISDLKPEVYQMMSPRPLQEMSLREQFMYHQGALVNLIKLANTRDICVKTHNAKATVDGVALIPPILSAGAIYLIRDPRDVAISSAAHFEIDIDTSIKNLADDNRAGKSPFQLHHMFMSWSAHIVSWTLKNTDVPVLIVRYEDLIAHTRNAFKTIIDFLKLDMDEKKFDFALEATKFEALQKLEKEKGFVEKVGKELFFRVGKVNQWKNILTKKQIDQIESGHKEVMKKYGYL